MLTTQGDAVSRWDDALPWADVFGPVGARVPLCLQARRGAVLLASDGKRSSMGGRGRARFVLRNKRLSRSFALPLGGKQRLGRIALSVFRTVIGSMPLDTFDPIAIGVINEEPIGAGDWCGFVDLDVVLVKVNPSFLGVAHVQCHVPRAFGISFTARNEMDLLISELEPHHVEAERARLVDPFHPQNVLIELSGTVGIRHHHRHVVDSGEPNRWVLAARSRDRLVIHHRCLPSGF